MNHSKYKVDLPYPPLDCVKLNVHDCKLVMQDYAGIVSEISATTQYFYHHLYAKKDGYDEIGETLMGLGIVEMHHLDILGQLIIKLGGDPKLLSLSTCNCNHVTWWCGDFIDYSKTLPKIILEDISAEKASIKAYSRHANMVNQECVSAIFKRIILDEELHIEILCNILNTLNCK